MDDELRQARETNARLNRRVQQLEGPWQRRLAKLQEHCDMVRGWARQDRAWAKTLQRRLTWSYVANACLLTALWLILSKP